LIKTAITLNNSLIPEKTQKDLNIWKNILGLANTISEKWKLAINEIKKEFNFLFSGQFGS
jgi:hypothetical protein